MSSRTHGSAPRGQPAGPTAGKQGDAPLRQDGPPAGDLIRADAGPPAQAALAAGRPVRLQRLSTTRLIGAMLVLVSHAGITYGLLGPGEARAPYRAVGLALAPVVSYFFVLTGFVITWSYADRLRPLEFYRGRVARLVPTNLLWWAVGIAVLLWYGFDVSREGALFTFLMLQAWVPDENVVLTANPAAWSLSVDVLFYALFPLLLPIVRAIPRPGRLVLAGLLVGVQILVATVSDLRGNDGYLFGVAYLPVARLPEFVLGVIAALEVRRGRLPRIPVWLGVLGACASLVAARLTVEEHPAYEWSALAAFPAVVLIVALAQSDVRGGESVLTRPRLVAASNWTFALYMLQVPVMRATNKIAGLPTGVVEQYLLAGATALVCVVLAWASYTWYETPLDRRIRGKPRRSTRA